MRIADKDLIVTIRGDSAELAKKDGSKVEAADAFAAFPMLASMGYSVSINARWIEHDDGSATMTGVMLDAASE